MSHGSRARGAIAAAFLLMLTPGCRGAVQLINKDDAIEKGLETGWEALQRSKDAAEFADAWCDDGGGDNLQQYEALRESNPDLPSISAACELVDQ